MRWRYSGHGKHAIVAVRATTRIISPSPGNTTLAHQHALIHHSLGHVLALDVGRAPPQGFELLGTTGEMVAGT